MNITFEIGLEKSQQIAITTDCPESSYGIPWMFVDGKPIAQVYALEIEHEDSQKNHPPTVQQTIVGTKSWGPATESAFWQVWREIDGQYECGGTPRRSKFEEMGDITDGCEGVVKYTQRIIDEFERRGDIIRFTEEKDCLGDHDIDEAAQRYFDKYMRMADQIRRDANAYASKIERFAKTRFGDRHVSSHPENSFIQELYDKYDISEDNDA